MDFENIENKLNISQVTEEFEKNKEVFRQGIKQMIQIQKMHYDECLKQGFSKQQALQSSLEYVKLLLLRNRGD